MRWENRTEKNVAEAKLQARSVDGRDEKSAEGRDLIKERKTWHKGHAYRLD